MGDPPPTSPEEQVLIDGFMSRLKGGALSAYESVKRGAGNLATGTRSFYNGASAKAVEYANTMSKAVQKYGGQLEGAVDSIKEVGGKGFRKFGQAARSIRERAAEYGSNIKAGLSTGASSLAENANKTYRFVSQQASNARALTTSARNAAYTQCSAMYNKFHDHATAFASKTHLTKLFSTKGANTGVPAAMMATGAVGAAAVVVGNKPSLWTRLTPAARKPLAKTHKKLTDAKTMAEKKERAGLDNETELLTLNTHGAIQTPYKNLGDTLNNPTKSPYVPISANKGSNNQVLVRAGAVADGYPIDQTNVEEVTRLAAESAKERLQVNHLQNYKHQSTNGLLMVPEVAPVHADHASPIMEPQKQQPLYAEIQRQAFEAAQDSMKRDEDHVKARAFHLMALENGRGMVAAGLSDATLEPTESLRANVYQSFQPNKETVSEAAQPTMESTSTETSTEPLCISRRMPVDVYDQPFDTPNLRHSLARVSMSPTVVHALDAHNVPIAEYHDTLGESVVSDINETSLKCKKLIEEYDLRRAAAAVHPEVYVHTLGVSNDAARRALQARVAHGGINPYDTTIEQRSVAEITASPSIAMKSLSELLDRSTLCQANPVIVEVVHNKHFGGRTATLICGDGKSLDKNGKISHMTIEGDARRNQIQAQLYAYEPFFHPQTSGQQYVFSNLSEGGLHHFQTTQCDPAITLIIDWVLRNIILDPLLPPIDVY